MGKRVARISMVVAITVLLVLSFASAAFAKAPGGDIAKSVFYIAVQDSPAGDIEYYYFTKTELASYEKEMAYTYNDHDLIKTVTCKGAPVKDLLDDLTGVTITDDMVVQYAEQDAYHADPTTAVIDSNYKDSVKSLTESTVGGSGSTRNPMRSIITYLIHEEYAAPDANNVNDPAGVYKDADNNSGYLRAYRDTGVANSTVIKYLMGIVVSTDGSLLKQDNGITVRCVSSKNPEIKVVPDSLVQGLIPGMDFAVKAPAATNATLASGQTDPVLIVVGSGKPATQVLTFKYDEATYFYVADKTAGTQQNYVYTDLVASGIQVPEAAANTAPYGYSRPMYYRYNGVWLSSLLGELGDDYIVSLVAKDGSKTDVTSKKDLVFVAYNNTQSKGSTNIPEGKRVTKTYNDAKVIVPSAGENITGSAADDYTTAGKDVDVLVAQAEGVEVRQASFTDLPADLLAGYGVTVVQLSGISSGYDDGSFRPGQNIPRAQFVKLAGAAFGVNQATPASATFTDVPSSHFYFGYIEGAYGAKLVNGIGSGLFGPEQTITREQALAIIARRVASENGFDLSTLTEAQITAALAPFADKAAVSTNLRDEMAYAITQGITKGNAAKELSPKQAISRIAAATLLIRAQTSDGEDTEDVALTVTKGTATKTYTLGDLKAMTAVSGYWGAHKGNPPYASNLYKGVPLAALLAPVGGLDADDSVTINTSDNFPCEYDAARLAQVANGTYQVWDKMTGAESAAAVQLIVAYEMDGSPLPADSLGQLRLVPVTATDTWAAEGKFSPHHVVALVVH